MYPVTLLVSRAVSGSFYDEIIKPILLFKIYFLLNHYIIVY